MKIRRVISLTVLLSFLFLAISGLALFVSPQGRVAHWADWRLLGLTKDHYSAIHTTFMVLFLTVGIWHTVLNWRPITGYLKDRSKKLRIITPESSVALGLALLFLVGPLMGLPPFKQFLDAGEDLKAYWEDSVGSPPWGHAEESSLRRFCRGMEDFRRADYQERISIDCDLALEALRDRGLVVEGLNQQLLEIADENGTTPQALAEIILSVAVPVETQGLGRAAETEGDQARFRQPYSGLGRISLRDYAEDYGYDLEEILGILREAGYNVEPDARIREVASEMGIQPAGVIDMLNGEG